MALCEKFPALEPGLYRHYKGGLYVLQIVAETHEHNGDLDAVYVSLEHGAWRTRPVDRDSRKQDAWLDLVEWPDHEMRHRFCPERPGLNFLFSGKWE